MEERDLVKKEIIKDDLCKFTVPYPYTFVDKNMANLGNSFYEHPTYDLTGKIFIRYEDNDRKDSK